MEKRLFSTLSAALVVAALFAQTAPMLQVRELKLSNGMTVWLNEDHTQPKVFGAVVVRAGAKDCPNTGIAHYFEHIMFKGTDRIGTVDYAAERPWLDSISAQYDQLSQATAPQRRADIQRHINELSLRAADYAIPNEFSRLIAKYGGSGLNAATGPDMTYYYNTFLPQYIQQWCHLNAGRLVNPVYRGFQGELENVYEEKNRSADNMLAAALEKAMRAIFKDQPYAWPVIGSTENLKNPRLSDMEAFYKKYYVAPNMGLILCGDITPGDELTDLLEQTFGLVQTGPVPERTLSPMPPIAPGERTEIRLPIPIVKAEALVFNSPTMFEADANAMMMARRLLSNDKAGLLDSLANEHVVMAAGMENMAANDAAGEALYIIPKIPFGKMKKAEAACMAQVQRIIDGDFSEAQLEQQKQELLITTEKNLENLVSRAETMIDVFSQGYSWQQYLDLVEARRQVTKADVMRAARKYLTANHITLTKKYGSEKKDRLSQPGYKPITPKNAGAKSAMAQELEQMPVKDEAIRLVNFDKDVERTVLTPHLTLYTKQNPANDIFTFSIRYQNGSRHTPMLSHLANYLDAIGTDSLTKQQLARAWQQLGVTLSLVPGDERFTLTLTGREAQLEPALRLLAHFLSKACGDREALKDMKQGVKVERQSFGKQKDDVLAPLISYVRNGQASPYLHQLSLKEVNRLTNDDLLSLFSDLQTYDAELFYVGRQTSDYVAKLAQTILPLSQCRQPKPDIYIKPQTYAEPTVFFVHVPRSRQNYVCSYEALDAAPDWTTRCTAEWWARYVGGGMSGLLFQHIREFRSLAYSTQGVLAEPNYNRHAHDPLLYLTITGTQADKTLQAAGAIDSLLRQMPVRVENMDAARQELLNDVQNSYPTFRTIGFYVANQLSNGYATDPDEHKTSLLPTLTTADVQRYHDEHVARNQRVWFVVGDRKLTNLQALSRFGKVIELKLEDIYKK